MKIKLTAAALIAWASGVMAYDNSTMNDDFKLLLAGDVSGAIHATYISQWGSWWYLILAAAPYLSLYLYQQSLGIASIWLVSVMVAYRYLLPAPDYITYLLIVMWVMTAIHRVASPVRDN